MKKLPLTVKVIIKIYDASIEIVEISDSVRSAAQWLLENSSPDLMFFDIQLGDGLSFEIFDIVEVTAPVIFTTAYDEYAIKAFKVNSIDYILKPLDFDDVKNAIKKFQGYHQLGMKTNMLPVLEQLKQQLSQAAPQYKNRFIIKIGDHLKSISVQDIRYIFSKDKTTYMVTQEGKKYLMEQPLEKFEKLLNPVHFFRIDRQYILTVSCIKDIISYSNSRLKILVKDCEDNDVLVSRERVQDFKVWLDN
ncbi:MAG: LytTR family DNA-binding domain-containing protein [Bacteroidota bacterium]|nr:LytTR family DNA-binding domain-containing protein [Bacteroidota bacterium]